MTVLLETLGALACLVPIIAIVGYLIWLSRRPNCPECEYGVPRNAVACPRCGCSLEDRKDTESA